MKFLNLFISLFFLFSNLTALNEKQAIENSIQYPSIYLNQSSIDDVENILKGIYSPLKGFMNREEILSVIKNKRLLDGSLWPIPIFLKIDKTIADKIKKTSTATLKNETGNPIAFLKNINCFQIDNDLYLSGKLEKIKLLNSYFFSDYCFTAEEIKEKFKTKSTIGILSSDSENFPKIKNFVKDKNDHFFIPVSSHASGFEKEKAINISPNLTPVFFPAKQLSKKNAALFYALIFKNFGCSSIVSDKQTILF